MDPEQLTTLSVPSPDPQNQSGNHHNVFPGWTKNRTVGPKETRQKEMWTIWNNFKYVQLLSTLATSALIPIYASAWSPC